MSSNRRAAVLPVASVCIAMAACSLNPATGQRQLVLMSEAQEVELGRRAEPEVLATFGEYPDESLQAYVDGLGQRLAAASERPSLPWAFHVLDDPLVNAFAYPGGKVYITRGILAHFNSEAELVSVLGHEIGHVTARHSVVQMSQQQLAYLGLGVAAVASEDFRPYAGLAAAGLQVLFLKFSRDDERQSDDLGLRYMTAAGYDPHQMPNVFRTFSRLEGGSGEGRLPQWQSTHPDPENRVGRIEELINGLPPDRRAGEIGRDRYLRRLEGMTFGDDPRQGYAIGSVFYHPDMAFRIAFPDGWKIVNERRAVGAISPDEGAVVVLTVAREKTPDDAARAFFEGSGATRGASWRPGFYDFTATTSGGASIAGAVGFIAHRDLVFRLTAYASADAYPSHAGVVRRSLASFTELRDRRFLDVDPARIELVELDRAMTFDEYSRRYPSTVDAARIAVINGVDREQTLEAGRIMKRVVGGELPD